MHGICHRLGDTMAMELAAELALLTASWGWGIYDLPSINHRPHSFVKTCSCAFPTHQTISPLRTGMVFPSSLAPTFNHSTWPRGGLSEDCKGWWLAVEGNWVLAGGRPNALPNVETLFWMYSEVQHVGKKNFQPKLATVSSIFLEGSSNTPNRGRRKQSASYCC